MSLEEALWLVAERGRLMDEMPAGSMLSVALGEADLERRLWGGLGVAAVNGPRQTIASGPAEAVEALRAELEREGVDCRPLRTSHAFHSVLLEPVMAAFADVVRELHLRPPELPCVSNVTGTWLRAGEATDPLYWARQLREQVRFWDGLEHLQTVLLRVASDTSTPLSAVLSGVGPLAQR